MFNRLYFDSNLLRTAQWPRLSSKLQSTFELWAAAGFKDTELGV